jgi:hypothetical protein
MASETTAVITPLLSKKSPAKVVMTVDTSAIERPLFPDAENSVRARFFMRTRMRLT